jgi:tetratricopeptide (TPR) repeat protein
MVVIGTKPEFFKAVWVRNEWSRYLALIKQGQQKMLIPAYRDMDPYDLPEEFSHLQAQDMSKLGFMQDLIRGIKKIVHTDEPKQTIVKETVVTNVNSNTDPLLKRVFMFLEDGDFAKADEFCEQVLNQDPENVQAYIGKLMVELRVKKREDLKECEETFESLNNYQKIIRFADEEVKKEFEEFKAETERKAVRSAKETAYKEILKDAGVAEKHWAKILKYSDVDGVELDDKGKITTAKDILKEIKEEWADHIEKIDKQGANTATPPANNGGNKMTKEEIMKIKDTNARQKAISENHELFGY